MKIKDRRVEIISGFLLLLAFAQMIYIISANSMVADEQNYPGIGKYTATTGDFSPFAYRYHGDLSYFINSIFLYPDANPVWDERPFNMYNVMNAYGIDYYLFLTRLPIALTVILLGFYVFRWAREIYGDKAALFALFLLSFEPLLLANGSLATTDAVAATFMFISMYYLWGFSKEKTNKNAAISGTALGLALLTKFTALIFVPLVLLIFVLYFRPLKKNTRTFLLYFACVFLTVWLFYGFHVGSVMDTVHSKEKAMEFIDSKFSGLAKDTVLALANIPLPAVRYINGPFGYNSYEASRGFSTLFFGEKITPVNGWDFWYYHITAFLIKEPIPLLTFLAIFLFMSLSGKQKMRWKDEKFLIMPAALVILFFSFFVNVKIGLRHILPLYPFLFVLLGGIVNYRFDARRAKYFVAAIVALSLWYVAEAASVLPYNMSYFNEFVGGPSQGYLYLTDANVDWGQGMKDVAKYIKENNVQDARIASMIPKAEFIRFYAPDYTRASCTPETGRYFIGISNYNFYDRECYSWLDNYSATGLLGYSVIVVDV